MLYCLSNAENSCVESVEDTRRNVLRTSLALCLKLPPRTTSPFPKATGSAFL